MLSHECAPSYSKLVLVDKDVGWWGWLKEPSANVFVCFVVVFSLKSFAAKKKSFAEQGEEYLQNKTAAKTPAWSLVMVILLL